MTHLKRELGLRDLTLFAIACIVGPRWIAVAASAGPGSVILWIGAAVLFAAPLGVAVAALIHKYPDAGGLTPGPATISVPGTDSCASGCTGSASR